MFLKRPNLKILKRLNFKNLEIHTEIFADEMI